MAEATFWNSGNARVTMPGLMLASIVLAVTVIRIVTLSADPLPLSVDEAQYWLWAQSLDFGYFSKPPVVAWLIAATTRICGDGEVCVRLSAPILHAMTTLVLFAAANTLFDRSVAGWSALVYLLLPGVSVSARIISTDVPLLLCWAIAFWGLARAVTAQHKGWWWVTGAAVGVGLMSKYAMILFPICGVLAALLSPDIRRRLSLRGVMAAACIAVVIVMPNLVWNARHGFPSIGHAATNLANAGAPIDLVRAFEFLAAQFAVFGPITCAVLLMGGIGMFVRRSLVAHEDALLLAFSLPIIAAVTAEAWLARAHANWAAPAYIAGSIFAARWMAARSALLLRVALAIHFTVAAIVVGAGPTAAAFGWRLPRGLDPAARERGWDAAGPWLIDLAWGYPGAMFLFDNRHAMAAGMYYARPHLNRAVMWNPKGDIDNHFEMTTDPMGHIGRDFIYVYREGPLEGGEGPFASATPLTNFSVETHPGRRLELHAKLLRSFSGYRQ